MRAVRFRNVDVTGATQLRLGFPNDQTRPFQASHAVDQRLKRHPILRSISRNARELPYTLVPKDNLAITDPYLANYERTVNRLFRVGASRPFELVVERIPFDATTEVSAMAYIIEHEPDPGNRFVFTGTFLLLDPYWYGAAESAAASPATVGGNADAFPTVTITSSATGTRRRLTVLDRTYEGVGGWMNGVAWTNPAAETWVWSNGVPMPFLVSGGYLWFRTDIEPDASTKVDIYHIAGSNNTIYANRMDAAGITLDANLANRVSVVANMISAGNNAISSSLTWHPMITAAHGDSMPYTFGREEGSDTILLKDRTGTGVRKQLGDDADSLVFTSPVEFTNVGAINVSVKSGIRSPATSESGGSTEDVDSVRTMDTVNGPAYLKFRFGWGGTPDTYSAGFSASLGGESVDGQYQLPGESYSELEDGEVTPAEFEQSIWFEWGGNRAQAIDRATLQTFDAFDNMTVNYYNAISAGSVAEALQAVVDYGGTVAYLPAESGGASSGWTFLITFPQGAFDGVELPFINMSADSAYPAHIEQWWVNADGNVITDDSGGAGTPSQGIVRLVQRYRVRGDDETWYTSFSQIINGDTALTAQAVTIPALAVPTGMLQVAVGLESAADGETTVDWGELTILSNPTITFMAGKTPQPTLSSSTAAMRITGSVQFDGDNDGVVDYVVSCQGVFVDTGLIIDADVPIIDDTTQPVYGQPRFSDPHIWVAFEAETVPWTTTGDVNGVSTAWYARWAI